jgi:exopolyphosphatase/guanosine-5'-triphosphate,3'-diphosphate pyrophosphatase
LAAQWEAASTRLIATSAARDARNQDELVRALHAVSGLKVEIISGQQEAEWVFRGVATDPKLSGRLLILDVGGGSTEFIFGQGQHHLFQKSVPLGSVRLLETLRPQDPPSLADLAGCRAWLHNFFHREVTPALEPLLSEGGRAATQLVGTGGTITILARMAGRLRDFDRKQIESMRLSRQQILDWMVHLWSLSLADRRKIIGLPSKRADVILMGVAIYEAVMEQIDFAQLYVSTRGLRFGALLEASHG